MTRPLPLNPVRLRKTWTTVLPFLDLPTTVQKYLDPAFAHRNEPRYQIKTVYQPGPSIIYTCSTTSIGHSSSIQTGNSDFAIRLNYILALKVVYPGIWKQEKGDFNQHETGQFGEFTMNWMTMFLLFLFAITVQIHYVTMWKKEHRFLLFVVLSWFCNFSADAQFVLWI